MCSSPMEMVSLTHFIVLNFNVYVECPLTDGTKVLEQMSMADVNVLDNFLYLLLLTAVFHIFAYISLRFGKPINT